MGAKSFPNEKDLALDAVKAIFPALSKKNEKSIKTKGCKFQKEKWVSFLLTKQSFTETLTFNPQCDLEGSFVVKMMEPFPIELKVKEHSLIRKIQSNIMFSLHFENKVLLNIFMNSSNLELKNKDKNLLFDLKYGVYIDPLNENPFKEHKGGELTLTQLGEKRLNKKIKIKFK